MENEIQPTILVTGFGLFRNYNVNASWEAVQLLPKLFKTLEKSADFKLVIESIPVVYDHVSSRVKELWEKHRPCLIIHVGLCYEGECLRIESQACSKGYKSLDILNKCPEEENIEEETLKTNCNVEKICTIINGKSNETGCRACVSHDAGRYLCEYIYYQSLSLKEPLVLFVHVPDVSNYSSAKTAQGLLDIITYLIEHEI